MKGTNRNSRYSSRLKFQVVVELLKGEKSAGELAKAYRLNKASINRWKNEFLEKGPEVFNERSAIREYENRIRDLERLIGHKEVELALLKNFLDGPPAGRNA